MSERRNTLVCCFEQNSPRMTALDIHEWIHEQLKLTEHSVLTIQIDGTRRQVYIKFKEFQSVQDILDATKGETIYKYVTGEIAPVQLMIAGMGTRRIRLANLPPELTNNTITTALSKYGEIRSIQEENWAKHYRYNVSNGVRIVMMTLNKHIPSYIAIAGYRALVTYDGQPQTCYGCGDTEHVYNVCPKRRMPKIAQPAPFEHTWANIVSGLPTEEHVPPTSDLIRMETEIEPQAMGVITPSANEENRRESKTVQIVGLKNNREEDISHKTVNSKPTCNNSVPLKWADEVPETELPQPAREKPSEEPLEVTKEWPPLTKSDEDYQEVRIPQISHNPSTIQTKIKRKPISLLTHTLSMRQ